MEFTRNSTAKEVHDNDFETGCYNGAFAFNVALTLWLNKSKLVILSFRHKVVNRVG